MQAQSSSCSYYIYNYLVKATLPSTMALSSFKRDDYFFNLWYLIIMVNQITLVNSNNPTHHRMHREFCIQKYEIDPSLTFEKTSSLLDCAMSCKDDCHAIWYYKDNGEKRCAVKNDVPDKPATDFDCQDPKRNVSVYLKRKVSETYSFLNY